MGIKGNSLRDKPIARYEVTYTKLDTSLSMEKWMEFVTKVSKIIHPLFNKICGGTKSKK